MVQPQMRTAATVLGSAEPRALADFYQRLLGWARLDDEPGWVRLRPLAGGTGLSFQKESDYVAPVWPSVPNAQQMTSHLDIAVENLDTAVAWAVAAGARVAEYQPQTDVRVMLDPEGHPFCLFPGDI